MSLICRVIFLLAADLFFFKSSVEAMFADIFGDLGLGSIFFSTLLSSCERFQRGTASSLGFTSRFDQQVCRRSNDNYGYFGQANKIENTGPVFSSGTAGEVGEVDEDNDDDVEENTDDTATWAELLDTVLWLF